MKHTIIKFLVSALAVFFGSYIMNALGLNVYVESYWTALVVALVISLLNLLVKPLLIILTLPITIITLGLFLIIINSFIFYLAGTLVDGFQISSIWTAILFSFFYSVILATLENLLKLDEASHS
ncbi:phage holin family protein [Algivirga pacifica]|uniref:Phage holin family protein n=1 Tax=Algivirga pacifica TaxID=1162670 RepID=A0ABP9DAB0_9BACT